VAEAGRPVDRRPGLREALLVGALVVVGVLLAAAVTFLLPAEARDVVFRTPLLIVVLIVGTGLVLWRITRPARPDRGDR
jgi:FtsH-binding integral membrane protein